MYKLVNATSNNKNTVAETNMDVEATSTVTGTWINHQLQMSVLLCTFIMLYIITVVIIFAIKG